MVAAVIDLLKIDPRERCHLIGNYQKQRPNLDLNLSIIMYSCNQENCQLSNIMITHMELCYHGRAKQTIYGILLYK